MLRRHSAALCRLYCGRWLQAVIRAIAADAGVVGKLLGVIAEAQQIVRLVVVAVAGDELGLSIALETVAHGQIENAVGAVAPFGAIAAGLRFEVVNVLGIELRPDVGGDVSVGHRHAVDRPGNLMASAHVKLVVHDIGARHEVGNDFETVAGVGAGKRSDLLLVDEDVTARRLGIQVSR